MKNLALLIRHPVAMRVYQRRSLLARVSVYRATVPTSLLEQRLGHQRSNELVQIKNDCYET